ncbi:MAG: RagB/SusD family nutrient uptake outer membrane protein [Prevotella sp.]|jgi:hypothetical protein|nr:RagB/SusD family nutrient uptake outer membrane protein [Prevotella sp.]
MNKFIKTTILIVISTVLLQSCGDFLDSSPHISIDDDTAIKDVKSAIGGVTGAYDAMTQVDSYGRNFSVFGDVFTDNVQISPTNSNRFTGEAAWSWTSSNTDYRDYWTRSYQVINRVNNIINASIAGDPDQIDQLLGESYAIRALIHFDMVRLFAQDYRFTADQSHLGIPYIKAHDPKGQPSRNTVAEVYTNILSDMEEAAKRIKVLRGISLENPLAKPYGTAPYTISPDVVNAIYARIYLTMGNYAKAKEYAELLIPKYSLVSNEDYASIWTELYSSESIFTMSNSEIDYLSTNSLGYIYVESGYGDLLVSPTLYALYADNDIRKSLVVNGTAASKKNNLYMQGKYPYTRGRPGLDNPNLIRVSEMYLIAAEAAARTGNEPIARKYLDNIRQRAIPTAPASTATGQALIDEILLEKRKELAFEGQYFYDLKRLHLDIIGATAGNGTIGKVIKYGDDLLALPIPQAETDANPNLAKQQNPGYN